MISFRRARLSGTHSVHLDQRLGDWNSHITRAMISAMKT